MGKDLKGKELGNGITQRKDGRYMARFTVDGKTHTIYEFDLKTLKKKFSEMKHLYETNSVTNLNNWTLDQFYDFWMKNYSINVKDTTIVARTNNYKRIQEEIPFHRLLLWLIIRQPQQSTKQMQEQLPEATHPLFLQKQVKAIP